MIATAFLDIPPLATAGGTVVLPGSKSISNRVLLLSALSGGVTTVRDLLDSDDTRVMLQALRQLGCGVQAHGGQHQEREHQAAGGDGGQQPGRQGADRVAGVGGGAEVGQQEDRHRDQDDGQGRQAGEHSGDGGVEQRPGPQVEP